MKRFNKLFILIILIAACKQSDNDIKALLQSKNVEDRIEGAYKAGESGKGVFIPYLLTDIGDPGRSTSLKFKGFSVYQEKVIALGKILKMTPPVKITRDPDSTIIRFYTKAASKYLQCIKVVDKYINN
jgi:hypothetical protein